MKLTYILQCGFRQLALLGLLCSPLAVVPALATELVGKPVPVTAAYSQAKTSSAASTASTTTSVKISETHSAGQSPTTIVIGSDAPEPPEALEPPEPPEAPWADDDSDRQVEMAMEHIAPALDKAFGHNGENLGKALLIPLFAIAFIFGGPVILIIVLAILHYRAKDRRQREINANIDKLLAAGRDIPVELLRGDDPAMIKDDGNLYKGMRNIGLGLGWLIFLTILCGIQVGAIGFIFIGLGVSQMVVWKLSSPKIDINNKVQG
jgi:hypothetical protein